MLQFLKRLFSSESQPSIDEMMSNGGVIVDVRSAGEYAGGHVKNSINIPLDALELRVDELDSSKPIVTCCASGMRSASAKRILKAKGFSQVRNGGGWASLKKYE